MTLLRPILRALAVAYGTGLTVPVSTTTVGEDVSLGSAESAESSEPVAEGAAKDAAAVPYEMAGAVPEGSVPVPAAEAVGNALVVVLPIVYGAEAAED